MNSGYAEDQGMMKSFILAFFDISLRVAYIPGHLNTRVDAISRNNLRVFYKQVPQAPLNQSVQYIQYHAYSLLTRASNFASISSAVSLIVRCS